MTDHAIDNYATLVAELAECEQSLRRLRQQHSAPEAGPQLTGDHLRLAFQNVPMPIFHQDTALRYTWLYNPAFEGGPSILGKTDEELLPPAEAQALTAAKRRVLQSGLPEHIEIQQWIDGREWWFEVRLAARRNAAGSVEGLSGVAVDITARKRAEEALRQSEERLSLIARATNDALYDWDLASGRAWSNAAYIQQFGNHPADLESDRREWVARIHPDDRERVERSIEAALAGDAATWTDEYHYRRTDGSYAYVLDRARIVRDAQGRAVRAVGAMLDLSERKQMEEALRASEAKFSQAFGLGPIVLCLTTLTNGRVLDVNESLLKFSGHTRAEVIGRTPVELGWWVSPQQREEGLAALRRDGRILNQEIAFRLKNGDLRTCLVSGEIITINGQRCVLTALVDITERKQAEARLQLLSSLDERLRASQDAEEMLYAAAEAVGEHLQVRRAFFVEIDLAHNRGKVHRNYCRGVSPVPAEYAITDYSAAALEEIRSGHTVVNADSQTDPRTAAIYDTTYQPNGERAYVAVPLMRAGVWVSTLWVSDDQPREWNAEVVALLETVAQRTWLAVENIRLLRDTQAALGRRKQAEADLRYQAQLLASVRDAIVASDADARLTAWNRAAEDMYGWKAAEVLGRSGAEVMQTRFLDDDPEAMRRQIAETGFYRGEVSQVRRDGMRIPVEVVSMVLRDEAGRVTGYVSVNRDITARRQAEEAVRDSEIRFQYLVQSLPAAVYTTDRTGRILLFNESAVALWGRRPEVGKDLWCGSWRIYRSDGTLLPHAECPMAVALREGLSQPPEEIIVERPDGSRVWTLTHPEPLYGSAGRMVGAVNMLVDITPLKLAQLAQREGEARYRQLVELLPDAVFLQSEGRIRFINPAGARLLGYDDPAQLAGLSLADQVSHPDYRERYERRRKQLEAGEAVPYIETVWRRRDGEWINVEVGATPMPVAGKPGALSIARDITARKAAEEKLRASEERLRLASEAAGFGVYERRFEPDALEWSPMLKRIFGLPAEAPVSAGEPLRHIHPDDLERASARIAAGFDPLGTGDYEDEHRIVREDGEVRWVRVKGRAEFHHGQPHRAYGSVFDITERKQTEVALRLSQQLLNLVSNSVPTLMFYLDEERRYRSANEAFTNWFGVSREDVLGRTVREFVGEAAWTVIGPHLVQAYAGHTVEYEVEAPYRLGGSRWVNPIYTPHFDDAGNVVGVVVLVTDITERKQAEEALRENERRYRNTFENSAVGISHFSLEGAFLHVNDRLCQMVGYTREELLATNWQSISHPDEIALNLELRERHFRGETENYSLEKRYLHKNGLEVWVNVTASLVRNERGAPLYTVAFIEDISARKRTEAALRESEQHFNALVNQTISAIAEMDLTGRFVFVNDQFCALTGYTSKELVGKMRMQDLTHPDDLPEASQVFQRLAEEGVPFAIQKRYRRKDGSLVWVDKRAAAITDSAGLRKAAVGVMVDITERMRAEAALEASHERERRFRERLAVLHGISLDLSSAPSIDELCRRAVERGRSDLGFDRVGIFLLDADPNIVRGTYGTDGQGRTRDEREWRDPALAEGMKRILSGGERSIAVMQPIHVLDGGMVAPHVQAALWDGAQVVGVISTDNALTGQPITDEWRELLSLYGAIIGHAITRHNTLQAVRASEERFRNIAETGNDGIWQVDAQARTVYANEYMAELLGGTLEELQARRVTDFCFEDDLPLAQARIQANLEGRREEFDFRFRRLDGSAVLVLAGTSPVHDAQGHVVGALGMFSDITERKRAETRTRFLAEATRALTESLDMPRTLQTVARLAVPALADWCTLNLLQPDGTITLAAAAHRDPEQEAQLWSLAQRYPLQPDAADGTPRVIRTGVPELHRNFHAEHGRAAPPEWLNETPLDSLVIVPLGTRGRTFGALTLASTHPARRFDEDDLALAEEIAHRAALVLESAQLFRDEQAARQAAEQAVNRLEQLQSVTATLAQALTTEEAVEVVGWASMAALNAAGIGVYLLNETGDALEMISLTNYTSEATQPVQRLPLSANTPTNHVLRTGEPLWFESRAALAAQYPELAALSEQLGVRATLQVPIKVEGHTIGVLALGFAKERTFTPEDRDLLVALANQTALALERARLYEAEQQANALLETRVTQRTEELRRSQEQLRHLSMHQHRIREAERTRIAQEIHDEMGGTLTGLKMMVARLRKRRARNAAHEAELDEFSALIDSAVQTVRRIASDLRPAVLDSLGLLPALEWQAQEFQKRTGIACHLQVALEELELDNDRSTAVFRVFQEALTNVARHAQATQVVATVTREAGRLMVRIQDNGLGLGVEVLQSGQSLGLLGMRERMQGVMGQFEISGEPGKGTTVIIRVPLNEAQAEAV